MLVFPGGGDKRLAIDADSTIGPEGAAVCARLTAAGVRCVLVKHRVPNTGCSDNPRWGTSTSAPPPPPSP